MPTNRKAAPPCFTCGVPRDACSGTPTPMSAGLRQTEARKAHSSPEEAFRCMRRHLLASEYTQIGGRDFKPPGDGEVIVLTKQSRYGGRLRAGKESTRHMPDKRKVLIGSY